MHTIIDKKLSNIVLGDSFKKRGVPPPPMHPKNKLIKLK